MSKKSGKKVASVHSVAKYILSLGGDMSTMKLQKLVYYCQAWSLVWDDAPLFDAEIQAWANGPVIPELFRVHHGRFTVSSWPKGSVSDLSTTQKETIQRVLDFYGPKTAQWLSDLSHQEEPWLRAREGLGLLERGSRAIELIQMAEYYTSLAIKQTNA